MFRRWCRPVARTATAAALLLISIAAGAQTETKVSLEYDIDTGLKDCPSEAAFRDRVAKQLGYDPFDDGAAQRVVARASPSTSGIEGGIRWQDAEGQPQGERYLAAEHRDCKAFARSLAFAMVVQIQLFRASLAEDPNEASTAPGEPLEPEDSTRAGGVVQAEPDAGNTWWMRLGLGPSLAIGLAPDVALLGRGFVAIEKDALSLEVGALGAWPSTTLNPDGSGFRSSAFLASVAPCIQSERFSGCAVTHFGGLSVRGVGVDAPRSPSGLLVQVGLRLGVSQPLGPFIGSLRIEALRTLTRWNVELNDTTEWRIPTTTFLAGLDVAMPFPLDP